MFNRITIIGLGLIGSSVARAAREHGLAKTIVGSGRNEVALAYAQKHGFIDVAIADPKEAVANSDLIILATPPSTLEELAKAIAPALPQGAIVMDVASVKQPAIAAIAPHIPGGVYFMPAHPIAGSEQTGVSAGRADLFQRKRVIVTPEEPFNEEVLQKITEFWKAMGARVEGMPAPVHDLIYAYVSHLPQLLAFSIAGLLAPYRDELPQFTRLCGSSPALWVDIFLLNKDYIIKALDRYLDVVWHIHSELMNAPEPPAPATDPAVVYTTLFPRIAASCLITTVMEAEKNSGFPFARFAGTGFADFTYPAAQPPDTDIERISGQYQAVAGVLESYALTLKAIRAALDDSEKLEKALTEH